MSQPDLEMKSFGPFEIKSEDRGEVVAVVATLGVVDKDGDVILPGAFPPGGARVKLSGYGHDVITEGAPPVGKGVVYEQDGRAIFEGKFFMTTQRGREAFHTTKELGAEGEWSFGFPKAVKTGDMTDEWRGKGAKRVIAGLMPIEASPVFVGAGWGTGTLSAKSEGGMEAPAGESVKDAPPLGEPVTAVTEELIADEVARAAATEPTPDPTPEPEPAVAESDTAAAEAKAAHDAAEAKRLADEARTKAKAAAAVEELYRVKRTLERLGHWRPAA